MRFVAMTMLLLLVGCTGSSEPRIAGAQDLAIKRVAASLTMHNALHSQEQGAYRTAKEKERDALFSQSVNEAKAAAEADPSISKAELVDEILKRVAKRDQNTTQIVATVGLMQKAQDEANKPAKDAAELLGIVLQFERTDGFSYTEMINTLAPLVPSPMPIGK
jgi:hypothetical protein